MEKEDKKSVDMLMRSGNMSRRGMMKLLSGSVIAGSSAGLMSMSGMAMAEDKPVQGGKLRAAMSNASATDTLDPAKGNNSGDYARQFMVYSGITELDAKSAVHPALAESIESEDGKVWKIKLRKGVTFHDGKALHADDVVWSLSRHKDPQVGSNAFNLAEQFEKITADSPSEVTLELAAANFNLPLMLATSYFLIIQKDTKDFSKGIGTGPFVLKSFKPGVSSTGIKNKNYWKPGLPYLDEVELLGITDQAARVNALSAGDLDMISTITANDANRMKASSNLAVLETKSGMYSDLIVRRDVEPGKNDDFLEGLKYLQPREMLVKTVMQGYADVSNGTPVPPWHPFYNPDLKPRPLDPEKAASLFKKAGIVGKTVEIVATSNIEGSLEGSELIQQVGASTGVKFKVRRVPYDGYWSAHWMKDPVGWGSINPRPTLDMLFSQFYLSSSPNNESGWKNQKFDQLVIAARSEKDAAKRKQMYQDMQTLIYQDCGTIVPIFVSSLDGYNKQKVGGAVPWPSGLMMGYRFHEFVWKKA